MLVINRHFIRKKADKPSVEVFIFDFDGEIYGEKVIVEWHLRLKK